MYLNLLIISLALLTIINFYLFNKELATPSLSFVLGFLICSIMLSFYKEKWNVLIHNYTYILVFGGCITLTFGAYIYKLTHKKVKMHNNVSLYIIPIYKLKLLFVIQILANLLRVYYINQYYGMGTLAENLVSMTIDLKYGDDIMELPRLLVYIILILDFVSLFFAFLIPIYQQHKTKYKQQILWMSAIFILGMATTLLSSGRTTMLYMIITFGTSYFFVLSNKNVKLKSKIIIYWIIGGIIFLLSFQQLGSLIGRDKSDNSLMDIAIIYCGAELQNLDDNIKETKIKTTQIAEVSFLGLYKKLSEKFKTVNYNEELRREVNTFNYRNGYPLGNVSSAFWSYYIDFGILTTFFVCFIIGYIMQYFYQKTSQLKDIDSGVISFFTFIYIILMPTMFTSFFTEKFFEKISVSLNLSFVMAYICVFYYLYGAFPWNKKRINEISSNTYKRSNYKVTK